MKKTNLRKLAAFTASILAVAALAVPMTAFAADLDDGETGNTITITDTDEAKHTYEAYQVFSGTFDSNVLTDIEWGDGVNGDNILTALKADTTIGSYFANATDAAGVAKALGAKIGEGDEATAVFDFDNAAMKTFAKIVGANLLENKTSGKWNATTNAIEKLPDGYYLIQDSAEPTNTNTDRENTGAKTRFIVRVTSGENVPVTAKHSAPTVMKKVLEKNYNSSTTTGDTVQFGNDTDANTAGVQNNYVLEKDYNDVADYSIGDIVDFTLYGSMPDTIDDYSSYYYKFNDTLAKGFVAPTVDAIKVYVGTTNVTDKLASNAITVKDNGDAGIAIGVEILNVKSLDVDISSTSIITVKYSAKLDVDAEIGLDGNENVVSLEYSNNPNATGGGTARPSEDDIGSTPEDKVIVFTYEQDFSKKNADTGALLTDAEFVLSRTVDGATEYLVADATSTDGNYIVGSWTATKGSATSLKTTDGNYKIIGLEDGVYTLEETKKPVGYNDPADPTTDLTITATTTNGQKWTTTADKALTKLELSVANDVASSATVDATKTTSLNDGIVYAVIYNTQGSTLPSTGGMGTTLFYVGGGALALGAGVLLVSKKRMANK